MLFGEAVYRIPEASKLTGLSEWTLWDYLKCGKIMRSKLGGHTVIRESELKKLLVDQPAAKAKRSAR
jgi:predicted DNA-binding transcriptional regulator AlpA